MKMIFAHMGAALAAGLIQSHAQNILVNGSFESLAYPTNRTTSLVAGTTNLYGWTIQGAGSVWLVTTPLSGSSFTALDGRQFIDFNHSSISVSQTFATVVGETYEASFTVGRFGGTANLQLFSEIVTTNGTLLGSVTVGVPQTSLTWGAQSRFQFVATDQMAVLQFRGTNANVNLDLAMDAASVERTTLPLGIAPPFRLYWETRLNRNYQMQYRSELAANAWMNLGGPIAGTGTTNYSEQPITDPQRFFRVILLP